MPERAALELVCPPGFASVEDFRRQLAAAVGILEDAAIRETASSGRAFLGVRRVLAQRPFDRPALAKPRRGLNPRIAGRDKWKRIEAISRSRAFLADHRIALLAFARGVRSVVFPHGTYWMRVIHGVRCAASG